MRRVPLPTRAPFAGRAEERQPIEAAWQAGRTVFVAGPPGVGKSRLAAECASLHGAALFVNCRPDDYPPALQLGGTRAARPARRRAGR